MARGGSHTWLILSLLTWCFLLHPAVTQDSRTGGSWQLLLNSTGAVAMHMALTHLNTVIMFDQVSAGPSALRMLGCHDDRNLSCWVHSVEYDVAGNTIRPLAIDADPWCSSGALLSDGVLLQTGGFRSGSRKINYFTPCSDGRCVWVLSAAPLSNERWYATDAVLPEKDCVFVVGGIRAFTYEFVPKSSPGEAAFELPFLRQTYNKDEKGDNLYPFVHLSSDGNLFIFANRDSILFDYKINKVIKAFPTMPDEGPRSYPSTASSVMLPLDHCDGFRKVEILVCGGAAAGAYGAAKHGNFLPGMKSCGRLVITDDATNWEMEDMPGPRIMSDVILLPTGDVLLINGATHGCAGWGMAKYPSFSPYLYNPNAPGGERFTVLNPSSVARMYHSTAILLADGRVLVGGSNPYKEYTYNVTYPTELRLETFTPHYMEEFFDHKRPSNISIERGGNSSVGSGIKYGEEFGVLFQIGKRAKQLEFVAYAPPFNTHSQSMSQRMLKLECRRAEIIGGGGGGRHDGGHAVRAVLVAPPSAVAAPSGYYLLTVVNGGIPSRSEWLRFVHEDEAPANAA
ncbi:hypothetical protein Cni_G20078 [Canna indica]|uniref:Galactose oxidase n=1 Tax=Canna indica TaxID=4628 RepID=A0AAQ3QFV9_9LILI|nr:hypothetical protein Cni_G20078 [Canna indica]